MLYLLNLLLAPGLAFLLLLWLAYRHRASVNPLTRCHLRQTVTASIGAGLLLTVVPAIIVLVGGLDHPMTWVLLVLYVAVLPCDAGAAGRARPVPCHRQQDLCLSPAGTPHVVGRPSPGGFRNPCQRRAQNARLAWECRYSAGAS